MVCILCASNITGDIKNFVQISTFLVLSNNIEIGTKFLISQVILTAQRGSQQFWKLWVIVLRIIQWVDD